MTPTDRDDWIYFPEITEATDPDAWSERERRLRYLRREHTASHEALCATVADRESVRWYDFHRGPDDGEGADIEAGHGAVVDLRRWA